MRILRTIQQGRWIDSPSGSATSAPADALKDLQTDGNVLSAWLIEDGDSNLESVIAAISSGRQTIAKLDYALADLEAVQALSIQAVANPGKTPILSANEWHRDLVDLSAQMVANLADLLFQNKQQMGRFTESKVRRLVADAINGGVLAQAQLDPKMVEQLTTRNLISRPASPSESFPTG